MRRFEGGKYEQLTLIFGQTKYIDKLTKVYPEWTLNRGMGFYFPKLKMELYGTPDVYAIFNVKK